MKAWKATAPDNVVMEQYPPREVGKGQVKLKMYASAIGDTEMMMYQGKFGMKRFPIIIGRQGVGMVSEVGEGVTDFKRGDRVYVRPQTYCGECSKCTSGRQDECEHVRTHGKTVDGLLCDSSWFPQPTFTNCPTEYPTTKRYFWKWLRLQKARLTSLSLAVENTSW